MNNSILNHTHYTGRELEELRHHPNYMQFRQEIENNTLRQTFHIYVLFPDESISYEIDRDSILGDGSYEENYENGQRRSLSFTLINDDGKYTPNINKIWVGTRLKLEVGLELNDGRSITFDKGIYVIQSAAPKVTAGQHTVNIRAADKFSLFESNSGVVDKIVQIGPDILIQDIIQDIISLDNGSGEVFDTQSIYYHSTFKGQRTHATLSLRIGDKYSKLLLDLATQLSAEIYYDASGHLVLTPINEASLDLEKPILYNYSTDRGTIAGLAFNFDYNKVINEVIVVGNSKKGKKCTAIAVNDNPASPLSKQRIGIRVAPTITDNNITTQFLAQERADYELRQYLILKSSSSATVAFNPFLEVNTIVTVSDSFYDMTRERFLLQGISFPLKYDGTMNITLSNLNNLPFLN